MPTTKNPNILLIRGLGRDQRHWHGFAHACAERWQGTVTCWDFPGTFGNQNGRQRLCLADYAAEIPCQHPTLVIGISLGGMLALELARLRPEIIGAVAMNSSAANCSAPWQRLLPEILPLGFRSAWCPRQRERHVLTMTSNRQHSRRFERYRFALAEQHQPRGGTVLKQLIAALRFRSPKNRKTCADSWQHGRPNGGTELQRRSRSTSQRRFRAASSCRP